MEKELKRGGSPANEIRQVSRFERVGRWGFEQFDFREDDVRGFGPAREVGFLEGEQVAIYGPKIIIAGFERHGTSGTGLGCACGKKDSTCFGLDAGGDCQTVLDRQFHDSQALPLIIHRLLFHEDFSLGQQLERQIEAYGLENHCFIPNACRFLAIAPACRAVNDSHFSWLGRVTDLDPQFERPREGPDHWFRAALLRSGLHLPGFAHRRHASQRRATAISAGDFVNERAEVLARRGRSGGQGADQ